GTIRGEDTPDAVPPVSASIRYEDFLATEPELHRRWPETGMEPPLERNSALVDVLGDPHRGYPVVHLTGTNDKTSTERMVDALLSEVGLRTGRYTSPHLQRATERINIDNRPITPERYVQVYRDEKPFVELIDLKEGVGLSKVEVLTPIGLDHAEYLGTDVLGIAREKAGIIKPGSVAVLAAQDKAVADVLLERCAEVDAQVARQDVEFGAQEREVAVGGQMLALRGLGGTYDEVFLPLHGEHQANNAALALAAAEALVGAGPQQPLDADVVRAAFAGVTTPGRLERLAAGQGVPTVLADAAHNPHGARALAAALT